MEWLFSHPDDMGDEPTSASAGSGDSSTAAAPPETAIPGTKEVPVKYKLKAFISHKGPSVHSGHYVAHINFEDGWIFFNDEKVVKADKEGVNELKKLAYLYVFERV